LIPDEYDAVNGRLGIGQESRQGDWPAGMVFHACGAKPGGWVVFEVCESRDAQERFMNERLGRAHQESGITEPPARAEWVELAAYHSPGELIRTLLAILGGRRWHYLTRDIRRARTPPR
jgi:hypothetical protein